MYGNHTPSSSKGEGIIFQKKIQAFIDSLYLKVLYFDISYGELGIRGGYIVSPDKKL